MLIKVGNDLFRILELHHLTPGNKRAHIQVRMRNIRTSALADHKFRAEEDLERAILDEREMQYLYNDGDAFYFMDTSSYDQIHISSEGLGDSKAYLIADPMSGGVIAYNPLPDPQAWTLTTRDGAAFKADGKVGLLRLEYRPWSREVLIDHQQGTDLAKRLMISGLRDPRVIVNGQPVDVSGTAADVEVALP